MLRWVRIVAVTSGRFNYVACAAVVFMMVLSCADVALRLFGVPIPGAYEMVGFLGALIVAFSLAYTSLHRGHVAVEVVFEKLPPRAQSIVSAVGDLISAALFGLISWQSLAYGIDLRQSGEVSLTLQMPLYPFVYSIAAGCGLLGLVLLVDFIRSVRRGLEK
jgi:TRAP-type C4-dicarboxylate transport system permease small subunit